jgi:hypothetical protein
MTCDSRSMENQVIKSIEVKDTDLLPFATHHASPTGSILLISLGYCALVLINLVHTMCFFHYILKLGSVSVSVMKGFQASLLFVCSHLVFCGAAHPSQWYVRCDVSRSRLMSSFNRGANPSPHHTYPPHHTHTHTTAGLVRKQSPCSLPSRAFCFTALGASARDSETMACAMGCLAAWAMSGEGWPVGGM